MPKKTYESSYRIWKTESETNLFEFVHHFSQLWCIHIFIHMFEHFVNLLHILHHHTLGICLLNLKSNTCVVVQKRSQVAHFSNNTIDTRCHYKKLIMCWSILNGCFRVDTGCFYVTWLLQCIQGLLSTCFVFFLRSRCFPFDHFFRKSKIELSVSAHRD